MSKKSESIEIRVSHELKSRLAEACHARGSTMSDLIRQGIDRELAGAPPQPNTGESQMRFPSLGMLSRNSIYLLPLLILAALYWGSFQSPVVASSTEVRLYFAELDQDGDGAITQTEYVRFLVEEDGYEPPVGCAAGAEPEDPCTAEDLAAETMARVDGDADGSVGYTEFEAFILRERAAYFLELDQNENGFVTTDEFYSVELTWLLEEPDAEAPLSAACIAKLENEAVHGVTQACVPPQEARLLLAEYDADRDGHVSLREFLDH